MKTEALEHHIWVLSNAVLIAKYSGVSIQSINLSALNLWAGERLQDCILAEAPEELLGFVGILRLTASHSALNVLALQSTSLICAA
jgi:hypothetical protein